MSAAACPFVSIVIPTHDRLPILEQCLAALAEQDYPSDRMEVIVIADGCTDGTVEARSELGALVPLRLLDQPSAGAAAARNRGAREARGEILLFVDDDVIASEGLVRAHVAAHASDGARVVVGPYRLPARSGSDYLQKDLRAFWERQFDRMASADHVPSHRDVVAGNLSLRAGTFHDVGGFDESFAACGVEDYELGVRLLAANVRFVFAAGAEARHLETTDLPRSLARNRQAGAATITLLRNHPHLLPETALGEISGRRRRLPFILAFRLRTIGRLTDWTGRLLLFAAERVRLRKVWRHVHGQLSSYWFWCGLREAVGTEADLRVFIARLSDSESEA